MHSLYFGDISTTLIKKKTNQCIVLHFEESDGIFVLIVCFSSDKSQFAIYKFCNHFLTPFTYKLLSGDKCKLEQKKEKDS